MLQVGKFSGNSYLRYPGLGDSALLWLRLEMKVKPEREDGLLLYNADSNQADTGDFLAVVLADGYVDDEGGAAEVWSAVRDGKDLKCSK